MDNLLQNRAVTGLAAFLALAIGSADVLAGTNESLRETVTALGTRVTNNTELVYSLAKSPHEATALLVKELHSIPETSIVPAEAHSHPESLHVIWVIRALRYLTHTNFTAVTSHVFGDTEEEDARRQFLTKKHAKELTFFGTWMSRDVVYVAPKDAQEAIIKKWTQWHERLGTLPTSYVFPKAAHIDEWYF